MSGILSSPIVNTSINKMKQTVQPLVQQDTNSIKQSVGNINDLVVNKQQPKSDKYNLFKSEREREDFVQLLVEFHRHKNVNTPLTNWPTLNGRAIDLYKLYLKVISLGGWERVCEKNKWEEVGIHLDANIFSSCTNGSQALKHVYIRYLSLFEKCNQSAGGSGNSCAEFSTQFINSNNSSALASLISNLNILNQLSASTTTNATNLGIANVGATGEESVLLANRRRFSYLLESTPMNYNYNQHLAFDLNNSTIQQHSLTSAGIAAASAPSLLGLLSSSTNSVSSVNGISNQSSLVNTVVNTSSVAVLGLPSASPLITSTKTVPFNSYDKLESSLLSGLPNEIDFVFNTLLLLSSDEYHAFRIYTNPRLIELMLAHIGFFGSVDESQSALGYRNLYDNVWQANDKTTNTKRNFIKFWHTHIQLPDENHARTIIESLLPQLYNKYIKSLPGQDLLNLRDTTYQGEECALRGLGTRTTTSTELKRIEQVLVIINNLSFEENNVNFMANKCGILIEFLVMCLYCSNTFGEIKKSALDILANLSGKLKLKQLNDMHTQLLLMSIAHLVIGPQQYEKSLTEIENNSNDKTLSQDRLEIIRGLEMLTKLCSQKIEPTTSDDYSNEKVLSQYIITVTGSNSRDFTRYPKQTFLERIIVRLEQLLSIQDVFILLHSLECLYNMTQFNEAICNMIVSYTSSIVVQDNLFLSLNTSPKIVSMLINFLTVDMSHFGVQIPLSLLSSSSSSNTNKKIPLSQQIPVTQLSAPIKILKIASATTVASTPSSISTNTNTSPSLQQQSKTSHNHQTSLLQQTLHNQHNLNQVSTSKQTFSSSPLIVSSGVNSPSHNLQQQLNQIMNSSTHTRHVTSSQEQQAKSAVCNWLRTCFQTDPNNELSKTKLYPYYQQVAKINNWTILPIPTFFELLNATFPNLRYNETTNQIIGLKLIMNIKQQMEQKKDELIQQSSDTWSLQIPVQKFIKSSSPGKLVSVHLNEQKLQMIQNQLSTDKKQSGQSGENNLKIERTPVSITANNITSQPPPPVCSIPTTINVFNITAPSIPLLTPPTPPPSSLNDNLNKSDESLKYENKLKIEDQQNYCTPDETIISNIEKRINENGHFNEIESHSTKLNCIKGKKNESINGNNISTIIDPVSAEDEHASKLISNGISKKQQTNGHLSIINNNNELKSTPSPSSSASSMSTDEYSIENEKLPKEETNESMKRKNSVDSETYVKENAKETKEEQTTETFSPNSSVNDMSFIKKQRINEETSKSVIHNEIKPNTIKLQVDAAVQQKQQCAQITNQNLSLVQIQQKSLQQQQQQQSEHNLASNISITQQPKQQQYCTIYPNSNNLNTGGDYLCEWNNCKMSFQTAKATYNHVCKHHLLNGAHNNIDNAGLICQWIGCDQIRRQKWSLINHIQERHCNENALKCAIVFRQRGMVPVSTTNNSSTTNNLANYTKDAAFIAIQRHQKKNLDDFQSTEEGPLTKSIRLLSALTLRNLARNSDKAKIILKSYESILAEVAFDLLESSNAMANCLWHLSH